MQFDVIFLCETWSTDSTAPALDGYTVHCVPACRPSSGRGRPAGGTAIYSRLSLRAERIHCDEQLSIIRTGTHPPFYIAGTYMNPTNPISSQLDALSEHVLSIHQGYFVVVGDFNCRIGTNPNELDNLLPSSSYLGRRRVSCDVECSARGSALLRLVDREGLVVLNGRTATDAKGDFTFVATIGRSVVDLVICSPLLACLVTDGGTLELASGSDHFPVFCRVSVPHPGVASAVPPPLAAHPEKQFRWNPLLKAHFNNLVQSHITASYLTVAPFDCLRTAVVSSAEELAMCTSSRRRVANDKPWFNHTCRYFKRCRQNALCVMRSSRYLDEETRNYLFLRRMYDRVLVWAKAEFHLELFNSIIAAKDSREFWRVISRLTYKAPTQSQSLSSEAIETHFTRVFHRFPCSPPRSLPLNPRIQELEVNFSMVELDKLLGSCPAGKAPGLDGISYEFYCGMDYENRHFLLDVFNHILARESIPDDWCRLKMFLLHKKGDPSSVENYRGISLLNCVAKLFTSLIAGRLALWADREQIMPENQSGFRPGRSCIDNIFIVLTLVHLNIRVPGNMIFIAFVDFKQAFDSVDHNVLWQKLIRYGCSNKIVNVLISLYTSASVTVRHGQASTNPIMIHNGVLQGDCLSPLLFCFMVADFEEYLVARGIEGVGLGPSWLIRCLFFADDLALFASTRARMQLMLDALDDYCQLNRLTVNAAKTRVVVFSASKPSRVSPFRLGSETILVAEEYTYLGITFSYNGRFEVHERALRRRVSAASFPISDLIKNLPGTNLNLISTLFNTKISSMALYGAEIWSLWSMDKVEQIQDQFYKRLFYLHRTTPGYALRRQFGLQRQSAIICGRALKWVNKVLAMDPDRWPHRCLVRLCHSSGPAKHNWLSRLSELCDIAIAPDSEPINVPVWISQVHAANVSNDTTRCQQSSHCLTFAQIVPAVVHIDSRLSFAEQRLAMQILLNNVRFQSIFWRGRSRGFSHTDVCRHCHMGWDSLDHMVMACPAFNLLRDECLAPFGSHRLSDYLTDQDGLRRVVCFVKLIWPVASADAVLSVDPVLPQD